MSETFIVTAGGKQLIESGVIHLDVNEVTFQVRNLYFVFKFIADKDNTRYESEVDSENNRLLFNLYNFNNSLGQGLLSPAQVGTLGGKKLYVSWFVHSIDIENNLRSFQYAFYVEA